MGLLPIATLPARSANAGRDPRPLLTEFLDPSADEQSGPSLSRAVSIVLTTAVLVTTVVGAAAVLAVIYLILPLPQVRHAGSVRRLNAIVAAVYIVLALVGGAAGGRVLPGELQRWLHSGRRADRTIQHLVVRAPLSLFRLQVGLWLTAAVVFGALDFVHGARLGLVVAATVALTGITSGACAYLVAERILCKPASGALATEYPRAHARARRGHSRAGDGRAGHDRGACRLLAVALAARATADPMDAVGWPSGSSRTKSSSAVRRSR